MCVCMYVCVYVCVCVCVCVCARTEVEVAIRTTCNKVRMREVFHVNHGIDAPPTRSSWPIDSLTIVWQH